MHHQLIRLHVFLLIFTVLPERGEAQTNKCIKCHGQPSNQKALHAEVAKGRCLVCHLPKGALSAGKHGKGAFARVTGQTCLGCHTKLAARVKKASHVHGPVAVKDCTFCHSSHKAKGRHRLKATGKKLCYGCHSNDRFRKSKHGQRSKSCGICHDPHGAQLASLVRQQVPKTCKRCHKDLLHGRAASTVSSR